MRREGRFTAKTLPGQKAPRTRKNAKEN